MAAIASENQWLRIGAAARLLGVTEATLRNWDREGRLSAHRHPINGYRMYMVPELQALLENQAPEVTQAAVPALPEAHWSRSVALDPKHRPQVWHMPSSTVRRDWRKFPQEAHVIRRDGRAYRRLDPKEIAVLQGFDPSVVDHPGFTDRQRIAAIGDAVPPAVARAVASGVLAVVPHIDRSALEVCAGVGGMAQGVHVAGFEHRAAIDKDRVAVELHRLSGHLPPDLVHQADVTQFDYQPYQEGLGLVCGGPPCQPWSQSGHRRGTQDARDLMGWIPNLVALLAPEAFVFENVPGLLIAANRPYLEDVIARLRQPSVGLRYGVAVAALNAADFGVPQTRRRIFIVGLRGAPSASAHLVFDAVAAKRTHRGPGDGHARNERAPWRTVGEAIEDMPDPGGWRSWPA